MENTGKYRHIFFDLDETLWDFRKNSQASLEDVFRLHHLTDRGIEEDVFLKRYYSHNDYYWDLFRKGKIARHDLRTIRWRSTLLEFGVDDAVLVQRLSDDYLTILPTKTHLLDGAIETLDYLNKRYTLHIITNGFEEVQLKKLDTSGLARFFTHVVTSERAGWQKPNPEIFLFAFQLSGASNRDSLFVGDSMEADIAGAMSVRMDHILLNPEKKIHSVKPMMEVSGLASLRELL